ncbi:MAG: hypothetical protein ABS987_11865, partial [Ruminococcus sp.]
TQFIIIASKPNKNITLAKNKGDVIFLIKITANAVSRLSTNAMFRRAVAETFNSQQGSQRRPAHRGSGHRGNGHRGNGRTHGCDPTQFIIIASKPNKNITLAKNKGDVIF